MLRLSFHAPGKMPRKMVWEICVKVREKVTECPRTLFQIFGGNPVIIICLNTEKSNQSVPGATSPKPLYSKILFRLVRVSVLFNYKESLNYEENPVLSSYNDVAHTCSGLLVSHGI